MPIQYILVLSALAVIAGLLAITFFVRRHQRGLLHRRRAVHQQRGAAHIRELALSTQIYTGRNDIALALLPLAMQMLEEAMRLVPGDHTYGAALREYRQLMTALNDGTAPTGPELMSALDSESSLNRAHMELIEAARLLGRVEKLEHVSPADLQEMLDALKQTQRSVELRLNLRQAAQVATLLNNDNGDPSPPVRASPSR
jgi:hypothetical protein